jgi:hypothetical protein
MSKRVLASTERDQRSPERTVCELTDAGLRVGREWLIEMLATPRNEFPRFPALSFIFALTPAEGLAVLERRTAGLRDNLAGLERDLAGESGPALDRQARGAYRERLTDLVEELTEAEERHDTGLAATLREERDFIAAELAAALGLGGRDRLAGDRVERARKAVAMRIGTALQAISEVHPTLARHLRVSVATGRFCVYRPEERVTWRL